MTTSTSIVSTTDYPLGTSPLSPRDFILPSPHSPTHPLSNHHTNHLPHIRLLPPRNIHLPNQHHTPHDHRNHDDGQIRHCEIPTTHENVFSRQNVPPQHAGERGTEGGTEGAIVDTESHAVDGRPEHALRNGVAVARVDFDPGLEDAADEDCGADVGSGELEGWVSLEFSFSFFFFFFFFSFLFSLSEREREREKERDQLTLHKTTDTKAIPPIDPTTPVLLVQ